MPYERNVETQKSLSREIKAIQGRCVEAIDIIENTPAETLIAPEEVPNKILSNVEGLRTEIKNSNTTITTDDNLLTSQFLSEIKEKTKQMEELGAFMKGAINDVDVEINRLKEHIRIAQEASSCQRPQKQKVKPEHLKKAKERFVLLKTELHGLIHSLYPDKATDMKDILGILMSERLKETSNGYIPVTTANFSLIELLKERNIVSENPYNKMEVKLAY